MRSLGLDVGDKRIGVALSDPFGILATPLTIIERRTLEIDLDAILEIIGKNEVGAVIIGLPLSMDGSVQHQAEKVQQFAAALAALTKVTIAFRDERFSTVSAKRMMSEAGKTGKNLKDDAFAAALILQTYLEENQFDKDTG